MKKTLLFAVVSIPILAGFLLYFQAGSNLKRVLTLDARLDWSHLRYPAETPDAPSSLVRNHDGGRVTVTGFMVPLVDELNETTEFLLVPYPQACIHVPAPPSDQIIHVTMQKGKTLPVDGYIPLDVTGILHIQTQASEYATSYYTMEGISGESFEGTYQNEYVIPFDTPCTDPKASMWECLEWKAVSFYYETFVLEDAPVDDLIKNSDQEADPYGPSEEILKGLPID